ncbi:MAG TPA: polyprenol phosphomannose-dependent alpha 1,6 mannosyltransferase MptB [Solirubrobacteraceae bacterium]|nr:polyprenol phosphomannose-dependent alpha 1,6 mannosyltransferase MptB [Solirubrobacteraceae bacterium]
MSSDASTLPLRDAPVGSQRAKRGLLRGRAGAFAAADERAWVGAACLAAIVACSLFVVLMSANRPSILSATTHANYFPHWMAGPLGGLLPGFTRSSTTLKYLFSGAIVVMYVSYLLGLAYVPRLRARWAIATVLAVHAIFFLAPPLALTDIFNYVNYGRMEVVHNLNPYTSIPILEPHNDPSYDLSNWHQLLSPYGPLFTLLTFAVVPLGVAASFWVLKGMLALASLGTLLLVWKCARLLGRDPVAAIVLVGLNPIVLVWGLGGDHNDFLMLFFILLAFYLLLRTRDRLGAPEPRRAVAQDRSTGEDRGAREAVAAPTERRRLRPRDWLLALCPPEIGAGAAVITATAIKASGGVLIPVVLAAMLRSPRRLAQVALGMAGAAVVAAAVSLAAFGLHIPDLSTQSRLVTNVSVPNLIGLAVGSGGETETLHKLLSAGLVLAVMLCCVQAWRRRGPITASGWASVALLVTLSWVLPWYVLWVLPMAALSSSRRLRAAALVLGVYLIIAWAPASGLLWNAIGFHPEKTPLGRMHQRDVKELLN